MELDNIQQEPQKGGGSHGVSKIFFSPLFLAGIGRLSLFWVAGGHLRLDGGSTTFNNTTDSLFVSAKNPVLLRISITIVMS